MRYVTLLKVFVAIDLFVLFVCIYSVCKSYQVAPTVYESKVVLIYTEKSACTGFIVDRGLIATAGHCIKFTAKQQMVRFVDGHEVPYKILSWSGHHDCSHDWALLIADTGTLPSFPLSDEPLDPGSVIKHIGHPKGSEKEYENEEYYMGMFEEGMLIGGYAIPGESGSPIINEFNQVVGIVTCSKVTIPVSIGTLIAPIKSIIDTFKRNNGNF